MVAVLERLAAATLVVCLQLAFVGASARAAVPVYGFRIVHAYPHDPGAFTEGLFYKDGFLYESTGLEGHSSVRKVALSTGRVIQERDLAPQYFGEGIVAWKSRLIQVTWRSQTGFVYDLETFKPLSSFTYPGEGWALTRDASRLIMSDGTPQIRFLDPATLQETGRVLVTADGLPVRNVNELEWVKGQIFANIWLTTLIARIDPKTGKVVGWIDLAPLLARVGAQGTDAVLNGVAYDAAHDRLFVTGKLWPKLYEIKLTGPVGRRTGP
jgi:glutaminyl-peptide cyclotransferase